MALNKRIFREFRDNFIRYIGLFALTVFGLCIVIGLVNSVDSIRYTYEKASKDNVLEDGSFQMESPLSERQIKILQDIDIDAVFDPYFDYQTENQNESILRLYPRREVMNKLSLVEGREADNPNEIVVDTQFAISCQYAVGDKIKIQGEEYQISGVGNTQDYGCVLKNTGDLLAAPEQFGIGFITHKDYEKLLKNNEKYNYSFKILPESLSEAKKEDGAQKLKDKLKEMGIITSFTNAWNNQRITSYSEDIAINKQMGIIIGIILVVLTAFIWGISILQILDRESAVIGTLYSMGYLKGQIMRHFLILPMMVTAGAAAVGTIAGFAVMTRVMASASYAYYSYPNLIIIYPVYLILFGIGLPIIITAGVVWSMLNQRLKLTPLRLLRKTFKKEKGSSISIRHFTFMTKFRMRVFLREYKNNIILFMGIVLGGFLLMMSLGLDDSIDNYVKQVKDNGISQYTYILRSPSEPSNKTGEEEAAVFKSLEYQYQLTGKKMEINVEGIRENSNYIDLSIPYEEKGIYISDAAAEKFGIKKGEVISLEDSSKEKAYSIRVAGIYHYPEGLYAFMNQDVLNEILGNEKGYYNLYLSNKELLFEDFAVENMITAEKLVKAAESMTGMMNTMVTVLLIGSIAIYMIVMYLLLKMILEKSTYNISLMKVFGFDNGEIGKLYLGSTFYTVLVSVLISLPVNRGIFQIIWGYCISNIQGFIFIHVSVKSYIIIIALVMTAYFVISRVLRLHISHISLGKILKERE